MATIYKLSHGSDRTEAVVRYFTAAHQCDAAVRLSEAIVALDGDKAVHAAWAHLERLPDSVYPEGVSLVSWTKTSDERPTADGFETPELAGA